MHVCFLVCYFPQYLTQVAFNHMASNDIDDAIPLFARAAALTDSATQHMNYGFALMVKVCTVWFLG
jgi:hypothetical protein